MSWVAAKKAFWRNLRAAAKNTALGLVMFAYASIFIPHERWRHVIEARNLEQQRYRTSRPEAIDQLYDLPRLEAEAMKTLPDLEKKMKSDQVAYLIIASAGGNMRRMQSLVEEGADIDGKSASGVTPLISAASGNYPTAVTFLLARQADRYAQTNEGFSAFDFAAYNRNEAMARRLWIKFLGINDVSLKAAMKESRSRMILNACMYLLSREPEPSTVLKDLLQEDLQTDEGSNLVRLHPSRCRHLARWSYLKDATLFAPRSM